jgi:glycosyltransferase involved in cell wall biosynthesis
MNNYSTKSEQSRLAWLHELVELGDNPHLCLPKGIEFIWKIRSGLEIFDCTTFEGRFALFIWWMEFGQFDYPNFHWDLSEEDEVYLFSGIRAQKQLPQALALYAKNRPDLQRAFLTNDGYDAYICWWYTDGQAEPFVANTVSILHRVLNATETLPAPLTSILEIRSDLRTVIDISTVDGRKQIIDWWEKFGVYEFHLIEQTINKLNYGKNTPPAQHVTRPLPPVRGLNVIGFASSVLGIGEDARMAATAAQLAGIDVARMQPDLLWIPPVAAELSDDSIVDTEKFPVSLFCLPPTEMMRVPLEGRSALMRSGSYKIGAWPWELPYWPKEFNGVVNLVDEIWAQSHFVAQSFATLKEHAQVTIHHVPLAIEIPTPTENVRARNRLPAKDFLFYIMFDGNSWLSRKNPLASVRAFQQAFAQHTKHVGLVIKAINIRTDLPMWQEIVRIAENDTRIHIITETLPRQAVINLMASCDAYISLHRSEGFGRVIAEAMLLGQPTITTNFSGNVDFCTTDTSFLVDGELIPLSVGDYLFSENQYWCDPSIDQAAQCLQEVLENENLRHQRALAGQQLIQTDFSAQAVNRIYRDRLHTIFNQLGLQ